MSREVTTGSAKKGALYLARFLFLLSLCQPLQVKAQAGVKPDTFIHEPASAEKEEEPENPFFKNENILHFKLRVNYKELLKDRGEERQYHQATLSYTDTSGKAVSVDMKVMVRGNRRRDPQVCRFPPLMLNFPQETMHNTVFGKVDKLKLVTHCVGEDYLLREYLVYKLYGTITEQSFRVRLCQVDYEDVEGKRKPERRYAFLLEDDDEMARRNNGSIMPKELLVRMDGTNELAMAKLALFQYMIGNTDWSVPFRHNIKLLSLSPEATPIPVPYDFDYAGIVSAPYAVPPPELGITSVRQRLFRGYSFTDNVYQEVVACFNRHREDFYAIYLQSSLIDEKSRKQTLKFLDGFYETINNPRAFQHSIVRAGQQNMKSTVVIKGLK